MTGPAPSSTTLSFEVFPPATVPASFKLWETMDRLAGFAPDHVSVTYGAQGAAQDLTLGTARAIHDQTGLPVAAHLTCARATRAEVMAVADSYAEAGITQIVALRGDAETPGARFRPHPDGFGSSVELISALAETGKFRIRVGAYPDGHPDQTGMAQNIDWLKAKIDAGAEAAITQFFFEPEPFLRFRDACARAGITAPLIPGILPVTNWRRAQVFAQRCGARVPKWLRLGFETAIRDGREDLFAIATCTELCSTLMGEGVDHLHFYTLNRADLTTRVCTALGFAPDTPALRNVA